MASREGIQSAYQKYLGRAAGEPEVANWIGNDNFDAEIGASPEAKAYASGSAWNPNTGNTAAPPGFDAGKWDDPNKHDPKYDIGRILAQHPNDMENAMANIKDLYPGTTFDGKDALNVPGYGNIDTLYARDTGIWQPQWLPEGGGGGVQLDHNGNEIQGGGGYGDPFGSLAQFTGGKYGSSSGSNGVMSTARGAQGYGQPSGPMFPDVASLQEALKGLFPGGAFNQDVVNRRTENASENLGRFRKSQSATDKAALASRGLLGSGPEQTAQDRLSSNIADQYSNAVSGIYADESAAADQRMIQALQMATGMSEADAQNYIDQFNASTSRTLGEGNLALGNRNADITQQLGLGNLDLGYTRAGNDYSLGLGNLALGNKTAGQNYSLGLGNLALGNTQAQNSYNLGQGNLNLGYDQMNSQNSNQSIDQLIQLLQMYLGGANQSAGGYTG